MKNIRKVFLNWQKNINKLIFNCMYRRFIVVKDVGIEGFDQKIKKGSELTIMNSTIYFNGGMVDNMFYDIFLDLINQELNNGFNFLKEVPIPYNKV